MTMSWRRRGQITNQSCHYSGCSYRRCLSRGESERESVLLLEHKAPCVLEPSDWTKGIGNGTGALYRNAAIISKQARKYMAAGNLNMIAIYNSCVVGVS